MLKLTAALNQALSAHYASDLSSPSLVSSFLAKDNQWYFSIVRYTQKFGRGKFVVLNGRGSDYVGGLTELAASWIRSIGGVPQGSREISMLEKIILAPTP